jgi:hypothetical protein
MNSIKPDSSPLPWDYEKLSFTWDYIYGIYSSNNMCVFSTINEDNAKLVCRAVNSHAALVDALESLLEIWRSDVIEVDVAQRLIKADAVLAAVKGEK